MLKYRFIQLAERHAATDFEQPRSVVAGNEAADRLRELVRTAVSDGGDELDELLSLLPHPLTGPWVAYTALEMKDRLTPEQAARCRAAIHAMAD